jgi:hypothetical protein
MRPAEDEESHMSASGPSGTHDAAEPPVRMARVFDTVDPATGPGFAPGHRLVADQADRDGLLAYLRGSAVLLHTTARLDDVVDRSRRGAVPASFRTDGHWVWTDTVAYYLEAHGLEPDPDLAAHIRAHGYQPPEVTEAGLRRAMEAVRRPVARPAWTHRP